ncbi:unnamed protein product [Adineta ricciae]|nr:unnamed protein product [Adineta ricciae]
MLNIPSINANTKWILNGITVAEGNGQGNGRKVHERGIVVDQLGSVYVADLLNHRIVRWCAGSREPGV